MSERTAQQEKASRLDPSCNRWENRGESKHYCNKESNEKINRTKKCILHFQI